MSVGVLDWCSSFIEHVLPHKPTADRKEFDHYARVKPLLDNYDACLAAYDSEYAAYRTWIDEDAAAATILIVTIEDHLSANIVDFEYTPHMWTFLREWYEITNADFSS